MASPGNQHCANCIGTLSSVYSVYLYLTFTTVLSCDCLQCFDAVGWATGRASGL